MVNLTDRELDYLNLGDEDFDFARHLPSSEDYLDLPADFSVYVVAKWCRRVPEEYEFTPYGYCEFNHVLKGYDLPLFED